LPKSVVPAAFDRMKLSAGVVVAVATDVVNSGERVPAENVVTVPLPPPPPHAVPLSTMFPLASNLAQSLVTVEPVVEAT
jgi:hypothetical protein